MPLTTQSRWKKITGRINGREFSMVVDPAETDVEHLRFELTDEGGAEDVRVLDLASQSGSTIR